MNERDYGKVRILFVCNTLYQIIGASCIREMFPAAEAEIILSDHSIANRKIYSNIEKFCIIFNKAYYVETKYLYEQDNNISKKEKDKLLSDINTVSSMLKLADKYDMFFCANDEPFTERIANYVKKTNSKASLNWFEDGLSAYYFDRIYFPRIYGTLRSKLRKIFKKVYDLTAYIDNYYVFKPEKMEWHPKAKIKKIDSINNELALKLGMIFENSNNIDKYAEKYIFFEDGAQDWQKETDVKLMNRIASKIGKENIIVRTHPRNPINRFEKAGFKTNQDMSVPWEIIAANINIEDKVLMTMYSQCVVTPDILMGVKGKVISLARLDPEYDSSNHEVYDFMVRAYFNYDREHYLVPQNMEEFEQIIENLQ